jgi:PAS domain S-box-containing protein
MTELSTNTAEAAIAGSEALQAFMNNSPNAIFNKDLSGRYVQINSQFLKSFGLDRAAVLSRNDLEIFPPEQAAQFIANDARVFARQAPIEVEETASYVDGVHTSIVYKFPIFDAGGRMVGLGGIATDITRRKEAENELRGSREQLRALASRIHAAREEERVLVAQNVHDELGQVLTAVKIDLTVLEQRLKSGAVEMRQGEVLSEIAGAKRNIDRAIDSVRMISAELRAPAIEDLGLVAAIEALAEQFERRTGMACRLITKLRDGPIHRERAVALFRILQEALTNIVRHAAARKVEIELRRTGGRYALEVRDDGSGIPESALDDRRSLGLTGMRERALTFGGAVDFSARPGGGTVVRVDMPAGKVSDERAEGSPVSAPGPR